MPSDAQLDSYYDAHLQHFPERFRNIERKYKISYAEAKDYLHTSLKMNIINELENKK